jgi:methanethiol S-methyltransferase
MGRFIALPYGLTCYAVFLFTTLYTVGFVSGVAAPKTIDTQTTVPMAEASVISLLLICVFAVQHSVMARKSMKFSSSQRDRRQQGQTGRR